MATNRTDSLIASSGGDYSDLQAWLDDIGTGLGTSTNLVTDDYDHYAWIAAEEFDVTVNYSFPSLTTDSTHHLYIQADSNGATSPASQHSHTKTNAALMDDSSRNLTYNNSYASFIANDAYSYAFDNVCDYTHFERLQFKQNPGNQRRLFNGNNSTINRCLFLIDANTFTQQTFNGAFFVYASLFSYINSGGIWIISSNTQLINCTIANSTTSSLSTTAKQMRLAYARPDIFNCALFGGGNGSEYFNTSGAASFPVDYNATDFSDLTSETGEGANNTYNLIMSNQFTAVDNTDWKVKAGHGLDVGTDYTSTVPYDIWGNAFSTSTSIVGCEQYQSVTPPTGWTGTINGVVNPSKINGVLTSNISKVIGKT